MKARIYSALILSFVFLTTSTGLGIAQTPDQDTPSKEIICDSLKTATPGLYGLCLSICEAQDLDSLTDPTQQEIERFARLVYKYNTKERELNKHGN